MIDLMGKNLRASMYRQFPMVSEETLDDWCNELFRYDPEAQEVVAGSFSGTRRFGKHIVSYRDTENNILTFLIPLR